MAKIVKNVIWRPHPRQAAFLKRREYEALYGGAAGGGKSDAALMLPLYWVHIGHFKALILRKTYPELSELIDRSRACYAQAFPAAKYNAQEHRWTFPSGATIAFGSMHTSDDREKYRGRQFDVIVFDELTHFTWEEYSFMFSRNRPSGPGTFVCMRATTNPGGIGHGWVKDRFITAAPPMTPISEDARIHMPDGSVRTIARTRIFVPATVHDNPTLLQNDPAYLANLAMLPSAERDAQLYGSWDSFSGQVFREWRNDPAHYEDQRFTHVVAPFDVPKYWPIVRGFDWGYARPFSVGWWAFDEDGRAWRVAEYYGVTDRPNEGVKHNAAEVARICEGEGARAVAVHARTRDQFYAGRADWHIIAEVVRAVDIPVLGNGDVRTGADARRMLEETGCAHVMVGRAAQGNPWVFAEIRAALEGKPWTPPTLQERMRTALRHLDMALKLYGEQKGVLEMRKHVAWYITGVPGAARLRERVNALGDAGAVRALLEEYAET